MCGIFGFAGKSNWRTSILLQSLCIADQVRGRHSTGLVIQDRLGDCYLMKRALSGGDFVASGNTEFMFNKKYRLALGHNRFATMGKVTSRNAHPFGVRVNKGWCFGVHNGIIGDRKTVRSIALSFGVKTTPNVDSEVVFWALAKLRNGGMKMPEAIDKVTERISAVADFAFAYMDTETNRIYLWRSDDRPLWVFDARKHGLGRWFCSTKNIFAEAWHPLRGALGDLKEVKARQLKPYRLYRMGLDGRIKKVKDLSHRPRKPVQQSPAQPDIFWPAEEHEPDMEKYFNSKDRLHHGLW